MKLKVQKALNLTSDGVARTIVCWYAKGGRTNLADWKGDGHFAMTSVLEEWEDEPDENNTPDDPCNYSESGMRITTLNDIIYNKVDDDKYYTVEKYRKNKYLKNTIDICCKVDGDDVYVLPRGIKPPQMLKIKRTEEEKRLRRELGEKGVKFGRGKYLDITSQGYSNTLTTFETDNFVWDKTGKIRELTSMEAFRLMDVDEEDAQKIIDSVPKTQHRKLAGNSIVVNVMTEMFRNLFIDTKENPEPTLF